MEGNGSKCMICSYKGIVTKKRHNISVIGRFLAFFGAFFIVLIVF